MHEIQPRLIGACSIVVGDTELTPAAPHLFALLLAFSLAPRDPWTRRGLQELLFDDAAERAAGHRLRQLLYRLRGFGVVLQESSTGVIRLANTVADPLDLLDAADLVAPPRASVRLDPLALYTPRMPAPFLDWIEQRRDVLRSSLAARRLGELRSARERHDWTTCGRLAGALYAIDPIDEEIVIAVAESNAMLGRRDTALDAIDQFLRDTGDPLDARPVLKRLRARVASTRIPRRAGTLRGRVECLAFLGAQWDRAIASGGGHVCALFGAPGMGKSRVGETFAGATRLGGAQVVNHRCDGQARQTPLSLFSQLVPDLRRRRGSIGADPALSDVLDQLAPGSATKPVQPRVHGTAEDRRNEVKRAIVDLLEAVSAEQPMLLVVDDAHLLDDASRGVIRWIADSANAAQLLVLLLCRPRPDGQTLLSMSPRFSTYTLTPLDAVESRALLLELSEPRPLTDAQVAWALAQADGNAFYLHALAQHPSDNVAMPAHIKSLAQTSYLGVSADARTVLDSCLLLDTLATPARVAGVAGVDDRSLLAAVRELEDADLLRYEDGLFAGPHAIIRDVLEELMPSTARALLQHRIAEWLSAECEDPARARMVGWAAVRAWLACGDSGAAVRLALKVAREAAAMGEPEAGAILLSQVPRDSLNVDTQRALLDALLEFAEAGKCVSLLSKSLRERGALAATHGESRSTVAQFATRLATTEHSAGISPNFAELKRIAADSSLIGAVRADAVTRILVDADMRFASEDAFTAHVQLESFTTHQLKPEPSFLRAQLVYHTTFGSTARALSIVRELVSAVPALSIDPESRACYSYAAFALGRLGCYAECVDLAERAWQCMNEHSHLIASEYFGGTAAEAHINLGNFEAAERILRQLRATAAQRSARETVPISGLISVDLLLGIARGDYARAARSISEAKRAHVGIAAPRLRGVALSHVIRLAQLKGDTESHADNVDELAALFARGKAFGGQDSSAEALWHAYANAGEAPRASAMLTDFLAVRREVGPPEALFRASTASDPAWNNEREKPD